MKSDFFEKDDLSISPYLNQEALPQVLNRMLSVARTPAEEDMLLMSALTAVSACIPNCYFTHGRYLKRYHANLMTFIVAGAASGKGVAQLALELVRPLHDASPLIIAGNNSSSALTEQLSEQGGVGYIHESEGSVITDSWRHSSCDYNTLLRKAAEHETISLQRRTGDERIEIPAPCLSVLLTGTFSQFSALVPDAENGLFSRLLPLIIRERQRFDPTVFLSQPSASPYALFRACGEQIAGVVTDAQRHGAVHFSLTPDQQHRAGSLLQSEYDGLLLQLGEGFHPSVVRMGVNLMRIALVLSFLRDMHCILKDEPIVCDERDFRTAVLITSKLLLHAADAYSLQNSNRCPLIPKPKSAYQQQVLLAALPQEFTTGEAIRIMSAMGVSESTAKRRIISWLDDNKICKTRHGGYEKRKAHELLTLSAQGA